MDSGQKDKIPCSIAIITSKADGLEQRLKALSEFGEVIICHGNAPEENLKIARDLGAVVVKQYDSDEPLLNSMTDKAAVRQVAMDASTLPWRFFMDRDDSLSPETIAEIREITSNPHPPHLVWRMPGRIFIENEDGTYTEVLHEAAYPAYQTRLVHRDVGARFKGLVHERIEFDRSRFSVGTMRNSYDFKWSKDRVRNYWKYLSGYAAREVAVTEFGSFTHFFYWNVYRRLRTILGYCVRVPLMYLRYGFVGAMPVRIELLIIRYHLAILFGSCAKYLSTRPIVLRFLHHMQGRPAGFTDVYLGSRRFELYGRVLSLGAKNYFPAMRQHRWHRITEKTIDEIAHSAHLPSNHFDTAMLYGLPQEVAIVTNVRASLRKNAVCVGSSTGDADGLKRLLEHAGFVQVHVWHATHKSPNVLFSAHAS